MSRVLVADNNPIDLLTIKTRLSQTKLNTDVTTATGSPTGRSSRSGNDTALVMRTRHAKRKPTGRPTAIIDQPLQYNFPDHFTGKLADVIAMGKNSFPFGEGRDGAIHSQPASPLLHWFCRLCR